jgi:hypothetical protein
VQRSLPVSPLVINKQFSTAAQTELWKKKGPMKDILELDPEINREIHFIAFKRRVYV